MKILFTFLLILFFQSQDNNFSKDELLGKIEPSKHVDFIKIESQFSSKSNIYLRKEAYDQFKLMYAAAKEDGINLIIISATRNFSYQKGIWERKWKRSKYEGWSDLEKTKDILQYSSMPGTSRHHWGTDVDFNNLNNPWFESGEGLQMYNWLVECAGDYGFYQTYTSKSNGRQGYEEEKWHWSYMPLASEMLKEYNSSVSYADLSGFFGSENAETVRAIEHYVNGIDSALLKEKNW